MKTLAESLLKSVVTTTGENNALLARFSLLLFATDK
jgi:hypothetical protein